MSLRRESLTAKIAKDCREAAKKGILMNLKGIKLTWLGHATFRIETPGGKTSSSIPGSWIIPMCPEAEKKVKKVDILLCTHGHGDHIGDAVEVSKSTTR